MYGRKINTDHTIGKQSRSVLQYCFLVFVGNQDRSFISFVVPLGYFWCNKQPIWTLHASVLNFNCPPEKNDARIGGKINAFPDLSRF